MFGIDISHHNGNIDWQKLSTNVPKVDFCFIKASQGIGAMDKKVYDNAQGCDSIKLPFSFYHFATLNDYNVKQDATDEAEYFISIIRKTIKPTLPLVLDIEIDNPKIQLDIYAVQTWIKTFFTTLENVGYNNNILYSGTPFLNTHLPKNHDLGDIPLWIAAYTSKPVPILPKGWNHYTIWQYSDQGHINGISSNVDLNRTQTNLY